MATNGNGRSWLRSKSAYCPVPLTRSVRGVEGKTGLACASCPTLRTSHGFQMGGKLEVGSLACSPTWLPITSPLDDLKNAFLEIPQTPPWVKVVGVESQQSVLKKNYYVRRVITWGVCVCVDSVCCTVYFNLSKQSGWFCSRSRSLEKQG